MNFISIAALCIGAWMTLNGILHDIFILASEHGKKYDRDLLRLLMDGHILITCGALQMLSAIGLRNNESWGYYVAGICCISLFVYCLMIFPFLKSFFTMALNLFLIIALIIQFQKT
jgi:uncharacterized membrane protein (DUF2068 family)